MIDRPSDGEKQRTHRQKRFSSVTHRQWTKVVIRLDEALIMLDEIDEGGGDCAALVQRAIHAAKKELRTRFGTKEASAAVCRDVPP